MALYKSTEEDYWHYEEYIIRVREIMRYREHNMLTLFTNHGILRMGQYPAEGY